MENEKKEELNIEEEKATEEIAPKKTFVFKEYYNSNEEFRKRHLEKMKAKVVCECGHLVNKYWMTQHKRTKIHKSQMDLKNQ